MCAGHNLGCELDQTRMHELLILHPSPYKAPVTRSRGPTSCRVDDAEARQGKACLKSSVALGSQPKTTYQLKSAPRV